MAFAGMIDGYRLLELADGGEPAAFLDRQRAVQQATGRWPGDPVALWTTAFLEARADRFGSDEGGSPPHLDLLIHQLRDALIMLETTDA